MQRKKNNKKPKQTPKLQISSSEFYFVASKMFVEVHFEVLSKIRSDISELKLSLSQ